MDDFVRTRLRPLAPGILFAMLAIAFGFGLGTAFGLVEDSMKDHLSESASAVLATAYGGDADAAKAVTKKSWTYFKRSHLHANALGTTALAVCLLLALLGPPDRLARGSALLFGVGALAYGVFWLFAGLRAPGLGSTGAAKESLAWLAIPAVGALLLGLVGTGVCYVRRAFGSEA